MLNLSLKKWSLSSILALFLIMGLLLPIGKGTGGSSQGDAPEYDPGYYPNESFPVSGASFYNVSGIFGENLTIIVFCDETVPNVIIWSPSGSPLGLASNIAPNTQMISIICSSKLNYTIEVMDPDMDGGGQYNFTLTILFPNYNPSGIPGFEFIFTFFGFLTALSLIIVINHRKVPL
jgi:hypothetical protein